jgi:hypothetical protein
MKLPQQVRSQAPAEGSKLENEGEGTAARDSGGYREG